MDGSDDTRRVARIAARQHGNISWAQLLESGLTRGEIEGRVDCGWLIRRHTSVYAVGHVPTTRESRWAAAVLALGDEAALSHRAAGALWGLLDGAVVTEVTVPTPAGLAHRDGIIVHRAPLPRGHTEKRDRIRVTSLIRTLLDLAAVLPAKRLAQVFEEAQVKHHLPPSQLAAEVICRRGYRGNAKLRLILNDAVDPAAVRSILELRFLRMCATHGIPRPLVNEKLGPWTVDFLWSEHGVVVETDGYAFHRTPAKQRRDALKEEYLAGVGLALVRATWTEVVEAPAMTAARVLAALKPSSVA